MDGAQRQQGVCEEGVKVVCWQVQGQGQQPSHPATNMAHIPERRRVPAMLQVRSACLASKLDSARM